MGEQPSRPQWWRFTGIAGLKRIMPDKAIRWAEERGYKWTRWYVPVCDDCPRYCAPQPKGTPLMAEKVDQDDYEARYVAGRLASYAAKVLIDAVDGVLPVYGRDGRRVSIMTRQHLLNKGLIETRWPGRVTSRGIKVRDILRQDEVNG